MGTVGDDSGWRTGTLPVDLRALLDRMERDLELFVEAALLLRGDTPLAITVDSEGACLFLVGAAEFLVRHHDLGDAVFRVLAASALRRAGLSAEDAERFLAELRHHLLLPDSREALREGGSTMRDWLMGDHNAPLRYTEVAHNWQTAHAPPGPG